MHMRWMYFFALLAFPPACFGQSIEPKGQITVATLGIADENLVRDFYIKLQSAKRKNAPRIIFVPGILGSKIDECYPDGSQCNPVWGTASSVTDRNIDLSIKSDKVYKTDIVDRLFFKDIYGDIIDFTREQAAKIDRDSRGDPLVTVFSYDWRISNKENAKHLKDVICTSSARAPDSGIVVIAHSMGGLILKSWAKAYSKTACAHGGLPRVDRLVFVATPHLGSPKAIKAIAEGYNLMFDEVAGLKRLLGWFERNYLLSAVNSAGISFPSIYELLPIQSSDYCVNAKSKLKDLPKVVEGEDGSSLNMFDLDLWRRYDLLNQVGISSLRDVYYSAKLGPMLNEAEAFLCDLADFDPSTVVDDIIYVYGREKEERTFGWFRLKQKPRLAIDKHTQMHGDGTVPVYSAQSVLGNRKGQTHEVQASHLAAVSSDFVRTMISKWYTEAIAKARTQVGSSSSPFKSIITAEAAASGQLLEISLDPRRWNDDANKFAISVNSVALDLMGYTSVDVAKAANLAPDNYQRAMLYAIAASAGKSPPNNLLWLGQASRYSYIIGRYDEAIGSSEEVLGRVKYELKSEDWGTKLLAVQAKETMGWAYLRKGEVGKFNAIIGEVALTGGQVKEPSAGHAIDDWGTKASRE